MEANRVDGVESDCWGGQLKSSQFSPSVVKEPG